MYKLGLKLWSVNTDFYYDEARRLYDDGIFDYIELCVVPDTLDTLQKWRGLKIPYIVHNAHSMLGFNPARADMANRNREIYQQTKIFADALDAKFIIFHSGLDGNIEETAKQLASFNESRALIENKPTIALPNKIGAKYCRGADVEELSFVIQQTKCGFCLDFGHAICAAASQKTEAYTYIKNMMKLKPAMFHISDVKDMLSPYDAHPHLGTGQLDIARIKRDFLPDDAIISVETNKDSKEYLNDFANDIQCLKNSK